MAKEIINNSKEVVLSTNDRAEFLRAVEDMEANSVWYDGIISSSLKLVPIPTPLHVAELCNQHNLHYEETYENAVAGMSLLLDTGFGVYNLSPVARATLYETAKLNGSALSRMTPEALGTTLNFGLSVAKGETLMLERYNKIMALHSSGDSGYAQMPISKLVSITEKELTARFGEIEFVAATHDNAYTQAEWCLVKAQAELVDLYQSAIESSCSHHHAINFTPSIRMAASDVARSAATLKPYFRTPKGVSIPFGDGVRVKHSKKERGAYGLAQYERAVSSIYAKFIDATEVIKRMAETDIHNPENCFVGIMNALNKSAYVIPRKYADAARQEVAIFAINTPVMSMHDIYLSCSEIISAAVAAKASANTISLMEEAITKILHMNWKNYDVGGTVAWGDRGGENE